MFEINERTIFNLYIQRNLYTLQKIIVSQKDVLSKALHYITSPRGVLYSHFINNLPTSHNYLSTPTLSKYILLNYL